jgi:heat shock protein 90kDa beta
MPTYSFVEMSMGAGREIFLRELISNANDALEKLRLTALKDKTVWDGADVLNVTIRALKNDGGVGGRVIITGNAHYHLA